MTAPQATTTTSALKHLPIAGAVDHDLLYRAPRGVDLELRDSRMSPQRDVRMLKGRTHADDVRVGFALGQTWEPVEAVAAHAAARLRVGLVEIEADGKVERLVAGADEIVV